MTKAQKRTYVHKCMSSKSQSKLYLTKCNQMFSSFRYTLADISGNVTLRATPSFWEHILYFPSIWVNIRISNFVTPLHLRHLLFLAGHRSVAHFEFAYPFRMLDCIWQWTSWFSRLFGDLRGRVETLRGGPKLKPETGTETETETEACPGTIIEIVSAGRGRQQIFGHKMVIMVMSGRPQWLMTIAGLNVSLQFPYL